MTTELYQLILSRAESNFLGLLQTGAPLDLGIGVLEVVVMIDEARLMHIVVELAAR